MAPVIIWRTELLESKPMSGDESTTSTCLVGETSLCSRWFKSSDNSTSLPFAAEAIVLRRHGALGLHRAMGCERFSPAATLNNEINPTAGLESYFRPPHLYPEFGRNPPMSGLLGPKYAVRRHIQGEGASLRASG